MVARIKIILVGNAGVGKSALFYSYTEGVYPADYMATLGVDFRCKQIIKDGVPVKLQIWDTAGHERFRAITTSYYRGADLIVLVYDITNKDSFRALKEWVVIINGKVDEKVRYLVVGNKSDLWAQRMVPQEEAGTFAASLGASYIEASAKMISNMSDIFENVSIQSVNDKQNDVKRETFIELDKDKDKVVSRKFFSGLC
jgi:small GTP-binding protein